MQLPINACSQTARHWPACGPQRRQRVRVRQRGLRVWAHWLHAAARRRARRDCHRHAGRAAHVARGVGLGVARGVALCLGLGVGRLHGWMGGPEAASERTQGQRRHQKERGARGGIRENAVRGSALVDNSFEGCSSD
eukprot:364810-Chlamydomonas_euryale.AAC.6